MANAVANVNPQVPAAIQKLMAVAGAESFNELAGGVVASFPIISYRGKVWRVKKSGEEHDILNDEGDPVPSIEMIFVKSNAIPSKIFYAKNYEEGDNSRPDCWSADGVKPDSGVPAPVSKTCAGCPNNVWGSKIAQNGNKTKACQDARRMAVVSKEELQEKGENATLHLLRVPPASLNPLKDYAEKVLKPKGIPYFAVTTKVGFDSSVAYPKLSFSAKRFLSDEEAVAVLKLRDSEDARRILAESEEFAGAGTPENGEVSSTDDEAPPTTPASATKKKATKPRPADEENVGLDEAPAATAPKKATAPAPVEDDDDEIEAPPPAKPAKGAPKKAAAAAPVEDDDDEIEAPPPAKPAKGAKKAPAPTPVEDDEEAAPAAAPPSKKKAAAPAQTDEFEGMLDSILNS